MLRLTRRAMTQLAIQRLPSTKLILDFPAVTIRFVLDVKVLVLLVHVVRRTLFPLRDARRLLAAVLVFSHFGKGGAEAGVVSRKVRSEQACAGEC
jgi:hypothetical protein